MLSVLVKNDGDQGRYGDGQKMCRQPQKVPATMTSQTFLLAVAVCVAIVSTTLLCGCAAPLKPSAPESAPSPAKPLTSSVSSAMLPSPESPQVKLSGTLCSYKNKTYSLDSWFTFDRKHCGCSPSGMTCHNPVVEECFWYGRWYSEGSSMPGKPGNPFSCVQGRWVSKPGSDLSEATIRLEELVNFPIRTAEITPHGSAALSRVAQIMKDHPEYARVELRGRAAENESNPLDLSQRRAEAVYAALVSRGVEPKRMTIKAVGIHDPSANDADDGLVQNHDTHLRFFIPYVSGAPTSQGATNNTNPIEPSLPSPPSSEVLLNATGCTFRGKSYQGLAHFVETWFSFDNKHCGCDRGELFCHNSTEETGQDRAECFVYGKWEPEGATIPPIGVENPMGSICRAGRWEPKRLINLSLSGSP